ncbi:unnamed protein product, partial [Allacma fusca]
MMTCKILYDLTEAESSIIQGTYYKLLMDLSL